MMDKMREMVGVVKRRCSNGPLSRLDRFLMVGMRKGRDSRRSIKEM